MTFQAFPLSPEPAYYSWLYPTLTGGALCRHGVYYPGEDVIFTLGTPGATAYTVLDFDGNTVTSGSFSGDTLNLGHGFDYGWYRLRLTGSSSDSLFGDAYGTGMFSIIRENTHFPRRPDSTFAVFNWKPNGYGRTDAEVNAGSSSGGTTDIIARSIMGLGAGRNDWNRDLSHNPHGGYDATGDEHGIEDFQQWTTLADDYWIGHDPVRQRRPWLAFNAQTWDWFTVPNTSGPDYFYWITVWALDGSKGDQIYCKLTDGSSSGYKLTVYYPDNVTVAETYDNVATASAMVTAVNAGSSLISADGRSEDTPQLVSTATAIGSTRWNNVKEIVASLYPYGFHHFEGPYNEWGDAPSAYHLMRNFQAAVHAGNANAIAMGPCTVNISEVATGEYWDQFVSSGALQFCDAISFHDYNTGLQGDINQGRNNIEAFLAKLREGGIDPATTEMWQTEATHTKVSDLFAVTHFRRSRTTIIKTLLWEQYGIPMEKNPYWYDISHGFWGYSSWFINGDQTLNPQATLCRVLAEETFGKRFHHRVDFGSVDANQIFLGNVYGDSTAGSVMALVACSALGSSTVTLTIDGTTDPLTVIDSWGNDSTAAQSSGRITVDVKDIPTYVRLPAGVNAWVYAVNDWGHNPNPSVSGTNYFTSLGGTSAGGIADGQFMQVYEGGTASQGITYSTADLPDEAIVKFPEDIAVERVIIWNGPCWQSNPGMYDFDVDTLDDDGVTWTTRETVTRSAPSSDWFGDGNALGSQRETFWDHQWIEDVKLASPVTTKGVRVYVRGLSYGGEPDADMVSFGGVDLSANGMATPKVAIQEISVVSGTALSLGGSYETEVLADSPVGVWPLDEASGTTAASLVNSGTMNATYGGSITHGYTGIVSGGGTASGNPIAVNGYVMIPDADLLDVGDTFTLECWYKATGDYFGQFRNLISRAPYHFSLGTDTSGHVYLHRGSPSVEVAFTSQTLTVGVWYHVVCTKSGSTTTMYLNAVEGTTAGTNTTYDGPYNDSVTLLESGDSQMQWVAIYPTALSAERVLAHYTAGVSPSLPVSSVIPRLESS